MSSRVLLTQQLFPGRTKDWPYSTGSYGVVVRITVGFSTDVEGNKGNTCTVTRIYGHPKRDMAPYDRFTHAASTFSGSERGYTAAQEFA